MKNDNIISTRGLKKDAITYCELLFDVNTAYFYNRGGYEFAKQFYNDAYQAAVEIVGGEQYILSAVMHADERNRAISEELGEDVYHYHLHVVYIPVVEKQILWSKRCKDPSLIGTVKETITQVSRSKKWESKPALDDNAQPLVTQNGKQILKNSYSLLQDQFFNAMRNAGYTDLERGERGSTEEHLSVTQFKVKAEQERLAELTVSKNKLENDVRDIAKKMNDLAPDMNNLLDYTERYSNDPEKVLPPAGAFETAKSYRDKKVKPIFTHIIDTLRSLYHRYLNLWRDYKNLRERFSVECNSNSRLRERVYDLEEENKNLQKSASEYEKVKKVLGIDTIEAALETYRQQRRRKPLEQKKSQDFER